MEHLSSDHKDHPNKHKNSHKLCNEIGHLILILMKRQWKLRQQHDQNFLMERRPLQNKSFCKKKDINPKVQDSKGQRQGFELES